MCYVYFSFAVIPWGFSSLRRWSCIDQYFWAYSRTNVWGCDFSLKKLSACLLGCNIWVSSCTRRRSVFIFIVFAFPDESRIQSGLGLGWCAFIWKLQKGNSIHVEYRWWNLLWETVHKLHGIRYSREEGNIFTKSVYRISFFVLSFQDQLTTQQTQQEDNITYSTHNLCCTVKFFLSSLYSELHII